jgi:hypothetical protein
MSKAAKSAIQMVSCGNVAKNKTELSDSSKTPGKKAAAGLWLKEVSPKPF